ncbi:putative ABC transport system permease protein [Filimonas zeae]|uniref:ABC transporter permease n=1 Tax=Filimonas zeae TaxID=1737353 RepID=A0A917IZL3_9BACT|nr:ABC transporter permease [Filimonas zeae]MDR6340191.1 putative ABC transport system permease protein [Filimonas zeae]GGH71581.1 ABC transporter permease [Filimonas zeae]
MLKNYFLIAWRNLRTHKTYAVINLAGLAVALAAFGMIALYILDEYSYDRYHTRANSIVRVTQHTRWNGNELHQATVSAPFAPALQAAFPEIEAAVRIDMEGGGVITAGSKKLQQGNIIYADKSLFTIFSYTFLEGDATTALAAPQSIVVDRSTAQRLFGSPEKAIGQTIYFDNNYPNTITGVIDDVPANSHLRFSAVRSFNQGYTEGWQNFHIYTYLLLKKGVQINQLQAKMPAFAQATIQSLMKVKDYSIALQPLTDIHLHSALSFEAGRNGSINRVYMFMVIAGLILLIAMINYMNLTTARAATRVKEIGVRKVSGSSRTHLIGMLITEALLATMLAAVLAIILAKALMPWFNALSGKELNIWRFGTANTILILFGFSAITGLISGLYPALFLSAFKTVPALKGQMGGVAAGVRFRKALVVFQFAVTVVMISCSAIIYRQLQFALHQNLGFNKEQVVTFHINSKQVRSQVAAIKSRLLQNTVIEGVAACGNPIGNNDLGGLGYRFEKEDGSFTTATVAAQELMADADYLPTMDIKLLYGRNFATGGGADKYTAALINETMQKKLGIANPVGKRIQFAINDAGSTDERTIVGVVKDFNTYSLQHKVEPLVMVMPPVSNMEDNLYVKIARGREQEGLAWLDEVYKQFDATGTTEYHFLDDNFARQYETEQKQGSIAASFTLLAIFIACLGLFGLATFTAAQRTKEMGIRKVLGADTSTILRLFSRDFIWLVALASLIAVPFAWMFMHNWLQGFAYRTTIQWWLFAGSGLIVAVIALVTISFQAAKVAFSNPVKSLRNE